MCRVVNAYWYPIEKLTPKTYRVQCPRQKFIFSESEGLRQATKLSPAAPVDLTNIFLFQNKYELRIVT